MIPGKGKGRREGTKEKTLETANKTSELGDETVTGRGGCLSGRVTREWRGDVRGNRRGECGTMPKVWANGRNLFYEEFGEGDPVAFLGGLGGDHRAFAVPVRALGASFRAMAVDHRDVGRSDRANAEYTTADMAEDVAGWFEALGLPPAHVVGHSMGGLVAQELVIRHPERVKSLTLVSTHAGAYPWKTAVVESWATLKRLTDPAGFTRATLPWLVAPGFYKNGTIIEGLIRFAERNEWPQESDAFARQARAVSRHQAHDRLGSVRTPTLVVVGAEDIVNPPHVSRALAGLIPGARFAEIPGVGHLPHVEDNGEFQRVILEFIRSVIE